MFQAAGSWRDRLAISILLIALFRLITIQAAEGGTRVKRIVGGQEAKPPPPNDPVVFTRVFNRDARVEGIHNHQTGIYQFRGLYFAEPPLGSLRYTRPVYKRLAGDVNATRHGPPCIQPDPNRPNFIIGEENCLLLDIYTPKMPDEGPGLPVVVWIHPGGFRFGSAAQYDATPMAQSGIIVVTPQYRLGSLGIMGDGTREFDGNLAIYDMAAALRWVNDYIWYFGGDPKQIKTIGHGSGAASAMYLSMSRTTRSAADVSGVIAMSGTALGQYSTDKEPVQSVQEVARINDCPDTNELEIVKCLRQKTAEEIIANDAKIQTERLAGRAMIKALTGGIGFQPHVEYENDRRALPSIIETQPDEHLENGTFEAVPLLTGVTKHETGKAIDLNSINRIYGSAEKFLGSVTNAIKDLTKFLRIDKGTGEISKPILPGLDSNLIPSLQDFMRIPDNLHLKDVLNKVTESTTDVLFNLPAVLTTQRWSKRAPAYMYSFEHKGNKSRGVNFLRGLPIVENAIQSRSAQEENMVEDDTMVTHGDELGYMFDCNDIHGNPMEDTRLTDANDLKVRDNLIKMIAHFAGQSAGDGDSKKPGLGSALFKSIGSGKGTPFIKVGTNLETGNDFRFCELSMLGASLNPLASTSCQQFASAFSNLKGVLQGLGSNLKDGNIKGLLNNTRITGDGKKVTSLFKNPFGRRQ